MDGGRVPTKPSNWTVREWKGSPGAGHSDVWVEWGLSAGRGRQPAGSRASPPESRIELDVTRLQTVACSEEAAPVEECSEVRPPGAGGTHPQRDLQPVTGKLRRQLSPPVGLGDIHAYPGSRQRLSARGPAATGRSLCWDLIISAHPSIQRGCCSWLSHDGQAWARGTL